MANINLITDRTALDVSRAQELRRAIIARTATPEMWEEWLILQKGCLNISDCERLEEAINAIAELIHMRDNIFPIEITLTEASIAGIYTQLSLILSAVSKLRESGYIKASTPDMPDSLTEWYKLNALEQILSDIEYMAGCVETGEQRLSFRLGRKMIGNRR